LASWQLAVGLAVWPHGPPALQTPGAFLERSAPQFSSLPPLICNLPKKESGLGVRISGWLFTTQYCTTGVQGKLCARLPLPRGAKLLQALESTHAILMSRSALTINSWINEPHAAPFVSWHTHTVMFIFDRCCYGNYSAFTVPIGPCSFGKEWRVCALHQSNRNTAQELVDKEAYELLRGDDLR
jgi:hypothetical protein